MLVVAGFLSACQTRQPKQKPVKLIFDTDMAPDYDDVGALAILHAMADSGEVEILAAGSSNKCETCVPCIEILNTYFGRPDIPLGAVKGEAPNIDTWHGGLRWTSELPKRYTHKIAQTSDAEDVVSVYRRALSAAPDTSVTIVTVGFFSGMRDLLQSPADDISPMTGKELVTAKVKRLVSMAGIFPEGREFNVINDAQASQYVFENWPTEIWLSGFEIGDKILTGKRVAALEVSNSPVKDVYEMSLAQDNPEGRQSWDLTAALVAVRGWKEYFDAERGTMVVLPDGYNRWEKSDTGRHYRLIEKMPIPELPKVLEDLMIHQPVKK